MFIQLHPGPGAPYGLRVDGRPTPALGIGSRTPRLAWRLPAELGEVSSLVLEVAASEADLLQRTSLVWAAELPVDRVAEEWAGSALDSRSELHWRVGARSASDEAAIAWSEPARFEVALADDEWDAAWITAVDWVEPDAAYNGAPPVLGHDFELPAGVARARLYAAGGGVTELRINGAVVGDDLLGPGYSVERMRLPARMWDVTALLAVGENRLRATVAGGISWVPPLEARYTKLTTAALPPRLLARLEIELTDGSSVAITTDDDWRATTGPVRMSHWYGGEDVDGRIDERDGSIAGDADWHPVVVTDAATPELWWSGRPPLRIVDTVPGRVHSVSDDAVIFDFGVNLAGRPVLELSGCAEGQRIEVRPAELLSDGQIDQRTTGSPLWDSYVTRRGDQSWHPRFVYHGFRYLEVRGLAPQQVAASAQVIRAANAPAGAFASDDAFLSTLHRIIDRAVQGNMYSVFTDCPNREKLGWTEQLHLCFGLLSRSYDVEAHLRDTLQLMRDAQRPGGLVPAIVPQTVDFSGIEFGGDPTAFVDDVNWGGVIAYLALLHYREYGDLGVLRENRDAVDRYLDHLAVRAVDDILDFGLGDWIALDETTPRSMVASYGYVAVLRAAAEIHGILGDGDGAARLVDQADRAAAAFAATFHDPRTGVWGSGSQASLALALDLGVVPADAVAATVEALVQRIDDAGVQLTVGENSWPALIRVLHAHGRDDLIDRMARNDDGAGYGFQIALGATSLAETWRGASGAMYENSQNHFMLGMIHDWMAGDLAGLKQAPDSVAWEFAEVSPTPLEGVDRMAVAHDTARGRFAVAWDRAGSTLQVEVPAGASARVTVPEGWGAGEDPVHVLASGSWAWRA